MLGESDARVDVDDAHFGCTADDDLEVALVLMLGDGPELLELQTSVVAGYNLGLGGDAGSGTADVECTEGQLCTGLSDGLCGDDTDHLALLDHAAGGQVTAVALGADTLAGFAGEYRADFHLLDRQG